MQARIGQQTNLNVEKTFSIHCDILAIWSRLMEWPGGKLSPLIYMYDIRADRQRTEADRYRSNITPALVLSWAPIRAVLSGFCGEFYRAKAFLYRSYHRRPYF